jgi:hypothetical protein
LNTTRQKKMRNIDTIYLFIFVFTILVSFKNVIKFMSALLQTEPKPLEYSDRELFLLGLSISYIITYIIQK